MRLPDFFFPVIRMKIYSQIATSFRQSLFLVAMLSLFCSVQGQNIRRFSTDGTTAPVIEPGAAAGSYALSGFDNVSLFNGNLNFAMPLLKMGGRGSASFAINLKIEKKWRIEYYRTPTGFQSCGQGCVIPIWGPEGQHYYPNPNWWSPDPGFGPGIMVGRWGGLTRGTCTGGSGGGQIINTLTFITNDGSEITFRDDLTNGQPTTLSSAACSYTLGNRGTNWHSVNGEGASFISDTIIRDSDISGEYFPSGYLLTKDGTRSRIENGNVMWTRDRNGNKITFTYQGTNSGGNGGSGSSSQLLTATDSLNRQISISYGNPSPTIITFKGFGGATRTLEVGYNSLGNVLRYDQTLKTPQQLFPDLPEGGTALFNPSDVPAYVKLPDGRYYYFKYNSYRELARVELPTGGAFDYDWNGSVVITNFDPNNTQKEIRRWCTEKRIYPNGGTGTSFTTRTTFGSSQFTSPTTGSMTTYDASGNQLALEIHVFHGGNFIPSANYIQPPWSEGRESGSTIYNGATAIRSTSQTWENRAHVSWYTLGYATEPVNDPRVTDATTTLPEVNLVSKVHTDYDDAYPYNNPKDVWEYDYGTGTPGGLIRRTHTEYAYVVNGLNYATDTNIHLRSLPSLSQVFDAASVKKSETTLEYDVYSGANHAALVDRPGIVGLDATYTTSKTTRGNVIWSNKTGHKTHCRISA